MRQSRDPRRRCALQQCGLMLWISGDTKGGFTAIDIKAPYMDS